MTIYVDEAIWPYGRMMMCHMMPGSVDQLDELHAMADKLGISRRHFQGSDKAKTPHYDICKSKRMLALKLGAVRIDRRAAVELSRKLRAEIAMKRAMQAEQAAYDMPKATAGHQHELGKANVPD